MNKFICVCVGTHLTHSIFLYRSHFFNISMDWRKAFQTCIFVCVWHIFAMMPFFFLFYICKCCVCVCEREFFSLTLLCSGCDNKMQVKWVGGFGNLFCSGVQSFFAWKFLLPVIIVDIVSFLPSKIYMRQWAFIQRLTVRLHSFEFASLSSNDSREIHRITRRW